MSDTGLVRDYQEDDCLWGGKNALAWALLAGNLKVISVTGVGIQRAAKAGKLVDFLAGEHKPNWFRCGANLGLAGTAHPAVSAEPRLRGSTAGTGGGSTTWRQADPATSFRPESGVK